MDALQTDPHSSRPPARPSASGAWSAPRRRLSVGVHLVLFWLLATTRIAAAGARQEGRRRDRPGEEAASSSQAEGRRRSPSRPSRPRTPKVKLPPPPKAAPPPPKTPPPPPPPNQPPPPPKAAPPPINIGISLSSTTQGGSFAAPVGNTLYGQAPDKAANPTTAVAYAAPRATAKFVPSYAVSEPPTALNGDSVKPPYPEGARKDGLEGPVTLKLKIDETGTSRAPRCSRAPGMASTRRRQRARTCCGSVLPSSTARRWPPRSPT